MIRRQLCVLLAALGLLAAAAVPAARAEAAAPAGSDCFEVTRRVRALQRALDELRVEASKAAPEARSDFEGRIADADARWRAGKADWDSCRYTIHIHALRVADCGPGGRAAAITPEQVARWVEKANEVYAIAHVRFEFDPSPGLGDWDEVESTEMNDAVDEWPGDRGWETAKAFGDDMAARYPTKVVVFFRHGPGPETTGGGFSGTGYDFIVMPGFDVTTVCGRQNGFLFAHELGHYFGLRHTFREFKTKTAAAAAFRASGNKIAVFDGDGLPDTRPDPYIEELQCGRDSVVLLGRVPFLLQRRNVMSYYDSDRKTLSPQQVAVVRRWVERRFADARDGVGPFVPDGRPTYQIVCFEKGRALQAEPAGKEGEARLIATEWSGAASQGWRIVPLVAGDAGAFEIRSVATGTCLGVNATGAVEGASVALQPWDGAPFQKWRFVRDERGDLFIESVMGPKVVTLVSGGTAGGADARAGAAAADRAILSADAGSRAQRWRLLPSAP